MTHSFLLVPSFSKQAIERAYHSMERPIANLRFYGVSSTIVSKPANANFLALQTLTERLTHHLCSLEHYYERIDHTGKYENLISCSRYDRT